MSGASALGLLSRWEFYPPGMLLSLGKRGYCLGPGRQAWPLISFVQREYSWLTGELNSLHLKVVKDSIVPTYGSAVEAWLSKLAFSALASSPIRVAELGDPGSLE